MVRFEFHRAHVHAGVKYSPGDHINLPEAKAVHLRNLGAGTFDNQAKASDASLTPSPRKRDRTE